MKVYQVNKSFWILGINLSIKLFELFLGKGNIIALIIPREIGDMKSSHDQGVTFESITQANS